jgi:hypothetical protein
MPSKHASASAARGTRAARDILFRQFFILGILFFGL